LRDCQISHGECDDQGDDQLEHCDDEAVLIPMNPGSNTKRNEAILKKHFGGAEKPTIKPQSFNSYLERIGHALAVSCSYC
jgi:hypothetical protein